MSVDRQSESKEEGSSTKSVKGQVKMEEGRSNSHMMGPPPALQHLSSSRKQPIWPSMSDLTIKNERSSSPSPAASSSRLQRIKRESTPSFSRASSLQPSTASLQHSPDLLQALHPTWKDEQAAAAEEKQRIPFIDFDFSTLMPSSGTGAKLEGSDGTGKEVAVAKKKKVDEGDRRRRMRGGSVAYGRHSTPGYSSTNFGIHERPWRAGTPSSSSHNDRYSAPSFTLSNHDDEEQQRRKIDAERVASSIRLLAVWEKIALKYGSVNPDEDDEIDIMTGEVVKNRGVVENLRPREIGGESDESSEDEGEESREGEESEEEVVLIENDDEDILGMWGEGSGMDIQVEHLPTEESLRQRQQQEAQMKAEEVAEMEAEADNDDDNDNEGSSTGRQKSPQKSQTRQEKNKPVSYRFREDDEDLKAFLRIEEERRKAFGEPEESDAEDQSEAESEVDSDQQLQSDGHPKPDLMALHRALLARQAEQETIHPKFRHTIHAPIPFFPENIEAGEQTRLTRRQEKAKASDPFDEDYDIVCLDHVEDGLNYSTPRKASSSVRSDILSSPWKSCVSDMLEEEPASSFSPPPLSLPIISSMVRSMPEKRKRRRASSGSILDPPQKKEYSLQVAPISRSRRDFGRMVSRPRPDIPASSPFKKRKGIEISLDAGPVIQALEHVGPPKRKPGRPRKILLTEPLTVKDEPVLDTHTPSIISTRQELDRPKRSVTRTSIGAFRIKVEAAQEPAAFITPEKVDSKPRKCIPCFGAGLEEAWSCPGRFRRYLCTHESREAQEPKQSSAIVTPSTGDTKTRKCLSCFEAGADEAWSCPGRFRRSRCIQLQVPETTDADVDAEDHDDGDEQAIPSSSVSRVSHRLRSRPSSPPITTSSPASPVISTQASDSDESVASTTDDIQEHVEDSEDDDILYLGSRDSNTGYWYERSGPGDDLVVSGMMVENQKLPSGAGETSVLDDEDASAVSFKTPKHGKTSTTERAVEVGEISSSRRRLQRTTILDQGVSVDMDEVDELDSW